MSDPIEEMRQALRDTKNLVVGFAFGAGNDKLARRWEKEFDASLAALPTPQGKGQ